MPQRITGHTELIGLIADPIRHSKSPMMHNTAFEELGLDYVYLVFEVDNSNLEEAVRGLRTLGVRGWNVSYPNKAAIIPYLDEILPAARLAGAVNTVINDGGRLTGTITDGTGFMEACRENNMPIIGKKLTLLGAGGAATAIAMQAALDGVSEISIFNRNDEFRENALLNVRKINENTSCRAAFYPLEDTEALRREVQSSAMLANATSCGFGDQKDLSPITDSSIFCPDLNVVDIIYIPEETVLMKMARSAGCRVVNGDMMMIYQGAASFKYWTGRDMPISAVKAVL